jgi:chromosome partitioning protein
VGETIAVANQKGGVGKTTTAISVAATLASDGHRILLVDVDPQGNATSGLGIDRAALDGSVYDALLDDRPAAELIVRTDVDRLDVLPSDRSLAGAEVELVPRAGRERRLRQALAPIAADYAFVLLDCPPSLGLLTVNGLTAADSVLIPLQCEYYALEGLSQLMATLDLVREHLNPALTLKGVLLTMYDGRTTLSADVAAEVRAHLGDQVLSTIVPRSVRLAEAPGFGRPIVVHSPSSRGAEAYRMVAAELLTRSGRRLGAYLTERHPIGAGIHGSRGEEEADAG